MIQFYQYYSKLNMNAPTVETITGPDLPEGYELMLRESIDFFLAEIKKGGSDFSAFQSIFYRLFQTMSDPPLGMLWFYLAVSYYSFKSIPQDPSKKFLVSTELFQLLLSISTPCNALKRVALLAPVIYVVNNSVADLWKTDLCLGRQIESLVERFIDYISMCCTLAEQENGLDKLTLCSADLIRVWTVDQVGDNCKLVDHLRVFFPIISDEVRLKINVGCKMDYLVGVVMNEIFLLRLQLKLGFGIWGENLRDMGDWAIQTIKDFRSFIFFDMLLRMMLEPSLPNTTLLNSEEKLFLRKVLYDAVLLGDFPFLKSGTSSHLTGNHLKNLSLVWLLVADSAIQFVREYGEHASSISYIEAYSKSDFPNLLIKWVTNQTGFEEKLSRPTTPTPKALIEWLLVLQDQGIRVFDEDDTNLHAKAAVCKSRVDYALPTFEPACDSTIFDTGNGASGEGKICEDQEMVHLSDNTFSASACVVRQTATHGRRKREEEMNDEAIWTKIVKYNFLENSFTKNHLPLAVGDALISESNTNISAHRLCTGSDMVNAAHNDGDQDMEDMA